MNCRDVQTAMALDFQAFLADQEAQAHVADCSTCQAVLNEELLVRKALARLRGPEVSEAMLARLLAIPEQYPDIGPGFDPELERALGLGLEPAAASRPASTADGFWRRIARRLTSMGSDPVADPFGAAPQRTGRGSSVGPAGPAAPYPPGSSIPSTRRPRLAELLLAAAAVAAVAAAIAIPRIQAPSLGQATATPSPSPALPLAAGGTPMVGDHAPAAVDGTRSTTDRTPQAADGAAPTTSGTPATAALLSAFGPGAPSDAITAAGDRVQDFCVQPAQDRVLFVLAHGKAGSAEAQAAAASDLRILQLPVAALLAGTAVAEMPAITPTLFADLADLGGPPHTSLTDIDCAADGRVLVSRRNQESETGSRGDLWLLDGEGRRLNARSLLWDLDEAPADAELSPDGRAALVLGAWEGKVHVLRLDDLAAEEVVSVSTGVGLTAPSGAPGGRLVWSPGSRAFLLQSYAAEGDSIDVFRWDGSRAERLRHGLASAAAGTPPAAPATLEVSDTGEPYWDSAPRAQGPATADRLLRLSEAWLLGGSSRP